MLTAKVILERLSRDGRLLERREQLSRCFTKGFLELLYCAHAQIAYGSPYSIADIDGNIRTVDSHADTGDNTRRTKSNLMIGSPPGNSGIFCSCGYYYSFSFRPNLLCIEGEKIGIQVGTGDVAVTPTDTALSARIAHGRSADELEYGGCELVGMTFSDPDGEFTIRRYFTNASGGSITVNEVGMHSIGTDYDSFGAWAFLIARDVVGDSGIAVADGEILRVTYVPQITA